MKTFSVNIYLLIQLDDSFKNIHLFYHNLEILLNYLANQTKIFIIIL